MMDKSEVTPEMIRRGWCTDEELDVRFACPLHDQVVSWHNGPTCQGCIDERGRQIAENARRTRIRTALEIPEVKALVDASRKMQAMLSVGVAFTGEAMATVTSFYAALAALELPTEDKR